MLEILHEASRTAGTAMVLLGASCLMMGMVGTIFTLRVMGDPRGPAALRLAQSMAVMASGIGLVGAMLSIPYFWMLGEIGTRTLMLTETVLLGITAVWAVVIAALLERSRQDERA
jgi:hypothetical protein